MPWQIEINHDNTEVKLDLKKLKDSDELSYEEIVEALQERKVLVDEAVEKKNGRF